MKISKLDDISKNFEKKRLQVSKKVVNLHPDTNQLKLTAMKKQEFEQKKQTGELTYHHTSVSRGYVAVNGTWYEDYQGRFGKGVIEHQSTLHSAMKGNSHHFIHYYIYTK